MTTISEKIVAALPAPAKGNKKHYFSGATLQGKRAPSGFGVRVTAAGTKSFILFYRKDGRPYLDTIGRWDENPKGGGLTVLRAIIAAKARADAIQDGKADPRPARTRRDEDGNKPAGETVADMLDEYTVRYLEKDAKLRGADTIKRAFDRLVRPAIGDVPIYGLRRSAVVRMLDTIADENGPVMADRTLAYFRKACNWRAARDDDFTPPIVRGMSRTRTRDRARDRVLSDDEIRDVWAALDTIPRPDCYARYVKFLLHTASRRDEASRMRWNEIAGDIWTIPGTRYKNKSDHAVPLTAATSRLIGEKPKGAAFVFSTTNGELAFGSMSRMQRILNRKLAELRKLQGRSAIPHFTLHDLRRTARSLMSRAGVPPDHAERAIGHTIRGVRATYDRHQFLEEKRRVFEALDALLDRILKPTKNVADLAARRKAGG